MLKTKKRYKATICDPITNYEVDFLLFLNEDEKPIQKGMVVVLHSYQIYRQGHIYKLNSSYRSYYYEEKQTLNEDKNNLVNQFHKIIHEAGWDNEQYKNISMFPFTPRSIQELKNIYKKTDDDKIYTSLEYLFAYF